MKIPPEIISIGNRLQAAGFQAYAVGGCVRDLLLGIEPKDWDLTTDAIPDQITDLFEHSHYDNEYGTVRIVNDNTTDDRLKVVEITTFRKDIGYSDDRRPDTVEFSTNLDDDLERRDFTINALAYPLTENDTKFNETKVYDAHNGITDLKDKLIRTVGSPDDRFSEDALRLLRAVRFAAQLDFAIDTDTLMSITKNAARLQNIAVERIADEFNKLIMTDNPSFGVELLRRTDLLQYIVPELLESVDVAQNQAHAYPVWEHLLRSLQAAADKDFDLDLRLSALFHDIAKPACKQVSPETGEPTFYNHEVVGAKMTRTILNRLKYPKEKVTRITTLVRWHMFFSDPDTVTLSAVRRLIANVGAENIWDLVNLRICDRIGTGRPKEQPYRLRKFKSMIEEASRQPTTVAQLAIGGNDLMDELHVKPGKIIGDILYILLIQVLDDPKLNTKDTLLTKAKSLLELGEEALHEKGQSARSEIKQIEDKEIEKIRSKYHVQ